VYVDVDVPDFKKDRVSFSGVILNSALAAAPTAPARVLRDLTSLTPTTERTFFASDVVTAFLRVYQGGSDKIAPIPIKVTNKRRRGQSAVHHDGNGGRRSLHCGAGGRLSVPPAARDAQGRRASAHVRDDSRQSCRTARRTICDQVMSGNHEGHEAHEENAWETPIIFMLFMCFMVPLRSRLSRNRPSSAGRIDLMQLDVTVLDKTVCPYAG
jgi:hypothetical protein